MAKKKTLLIFGISSFVGSNLAESLKDEYRVVGTYWSSPVDFPGVLTLECDIREKSSVEAVVRLFRPDVAIYAVGLSGVAACQDDPELAEALNTTGVFNVSAATERYKSKLVYFSSCFVFSGLDGPGQESDPPMPTSVYGNTVASAEFYIQKSCLNYIIFRCSPIMGRSFSLTAPTWLEELERGAYLSQGLPCDSFTRHGFIDIWTLADLLKKALRLNITNRLFQTSSTDAVTRYDFAQRYFAKLDGNTALLAAEKWAFPVPKNKLKRSGELVFEMNVENVTEALEIEMPSVDKVVDKIYKKLKGDGPVRKRKKDKDVVFI